MMKLVFTRTEKLELEVLLYTNSKSPQFQKLLGTNKKLLVFILIGLAIILLFSANSLHFLLLLSVPLQLLFFHDFSDSFICAPLKN